MTIYIFASPPLYPFEIEMSSFVDITRYIVSKRIESVNIFALALKIDIKVDFQKRYVIQISARLKYHFCYAIKVSSNNCCQVISLVLIGNVDSPSL